MNIKRIVFAALLLGFLVPIQFTKKARAVAPHKPATAYQFVEVETAVYR